MICPATGLQLSTAYVMPIVGAMTNTPVKSNPIMTTAWQGDIQQDYFLTLTPLEENKPALLAGIEVLHGQKYIRVTSELARIHLFRRQESENGPVYSPRGAQALMPSYLALLLAVLSLQ